MQRTVPSRRPYAVHRCSHVLHLSHVAWSACMSLCVGHTDKLCKTAEPIEMPLSGRLAWDQRTWSETAVKIPPHWKGQFYGGFAWNQIWMSAEMLPWTLARSVRRIHSSLPRDAMLAWYLLSSYVRLSVCYKPVLYRNNRTNRAGFWHGGFLSLILHSVVRLVISKN